ncbi:AMP-binding protein [Plantactinospora sp. CA-290183]|uniref:AMP-binding protein n=1 Tax=Plantactinospora sp. CA-290183 TaxID=3240006 RepID=UPI003D93B471
MTAEHRPAGPTVLNLWSTATTRHHHRIAMSAQNGWTARYAEVTSAATTVAEDLAGRIEPGDPVLIRLPRGPLWLPTLLGLWQARAVAVPARADEDETLAARVGARWEVAAGRQAPPGWPDGYQVRATGVSGPRHSALTDRHAYVLATSGTTGTPKLAAVTHATSAGVLTGLRDRIPVAADECAVHTATFTFSSSIRQLLLPLLHGAQIVITNPARRFDPHQLLNTAEQARATMLDLTPSQLTALTHWLETDAQARAPEYLRRLLVASEAFTPALLARWHRRSGTTHTVYHLYGQTETGGAVSAQPLTLADAAADRLPLAVPAPAFTAVLDRPAGTAEDQPTELFLSGLDPADGYIEENGLERSRYDSVAGGLSGLYRTGDLFVRDADQLTMRFAGRTDTDVKILGVRVDPLAIEQAVGGVAGVGHAAVVVSPGAGGADLLHVAWTTTTDDNLRPAVAQAATAALGPQVATPLLHPLDVMPLTTSGKLDRAALRGQIAAPSNAGPAEPAQTGDQDVIADLWRAATRNADADSDFFAAGGNSLSMLELLAGIVQHTGVRILPQQFHHQPTLDGLRELLRAASSQPAAADNRAAVGNEAAGDDRVPAGSLTRRVWVAECIGGPDPAAFWIPVGLQIDGELDLRRLEVALRRVAGRFDVLRAAVHPEGAKLTLIGDRVAVDRFTVRRAAALGSLTSGEPLLRVSAHTQTGRTDIALRLHHGIADRTSLTTILQALAEAYTDPTADPAPAPSYLSWRTRRAAAGNPEQARDYWRRVLPRRHSGDIVPGSARIARVSRPAGALAATAGASRHAAWLWAYSQALAAHRLPQPHLIGVDVDLREPGEALLVGPSVQTLPVVVPAADVAGRGPRATTGVLAELLSHRDIDIDTIVEPSRRPTGDPRQPYYRHLLVHQHTDYPALLFDGTTATYVRTPPGIAAHTTTLYVRERDAGATDVELAFDARFLDAGTAQTMLDTVVATATLAQEVTR